MKDLVLFFTGRARCANAASDQQGRADGDENCRAVRLKLEEPVCEVMKMKRMHRDTPLHYETRSPGVGFPGYKIFIGVASVLA